MCIFVLVVQMVARLKDKMEMLEPRDGKLAVYSSLFVYFQ